MSKFEKFEKIEMKNINKILGILAFFTLIGINISAEPVNLTNNETSDVEDIVNDYINSSI